MGETRDHLVLGVVQGFTWRHIEPFVVSLRATGYDGHICFMYRDMTADALLCLAAAGVELVSTPLVSVPVPGRRPKVRNILYTLHRSPLGMFGLVPRVSRMGIDTAARLSRDPYGTKARIVHPLLSIYMMRFPAWYLYLARQHCRFKRVMLTDVGDVLFQRNPFDYQFDGDLSVFLEEADKTIGTCPHTGPLVLDRFGSEVFHQVESRPSSCAGVTIGSADAILRYLRSMIDESTWLLDVSNQGIHNVLLYRGAFDPVHVFPNEDGPVFSMGTVPSTALRFDHDGCLLNAHGTVFNVLHQYDRHLGRDGIRLERTANTFRLVRTAEGDFAS